VVVVVVVVVLGGGGWRQEVDKGRDSNSNSGAAVNLPGQP